MKTTMKGLIVMIIFVGTISCEKNYTTEGNFDITGTWIEVLSKSDTLVFTSIGSSPYIELNRGYEIRDGYRLPKYGSGFYAYELFADNRIGLCYGFSSSCIPGYPESYTPYYFKWIDRNTFMISNFYNPKLNPDLHFFFSRLY